MSAEEIRGACEVLKTARQLGAEYRFAMVQLHEPPKAQVLAYQPGKTTERSAFLMVLDANTGETHEAVVNVSGGTVVSWVQHITETPPYQPVVKVPFWKHREVKKFRFIVLENQFHGF